MSSSNWELISTAPDDEWFWAAEFDKNGEVQSHIFLVYNDLGEFRWQSPIFATTSDPREIKFRRKNGSFQPTHWRPLEEGWIQLG